MNIVSISGFIYLLFYFILAGQSVFYLFCFSKVFTMIDASGFITIRKLAAPLLERPLRFWYYGCLVVGVVHLAICFSKMPALWFFFNLLSYILLLLDVVLAKRHNIPVNKIIDGLVQHNTSEAEMSQLRDKWLKWIDIRGRVLIAGFILLLAISTITNHA
jgi:hypothetical protein